MTVSHGRIETFHGGSGGGLRHTARVKFGGTAGWGGTFRAAAAVSGVFAADTIPGVRSGREALNNLLKPGAAARDGRSGSGGKIQFRVPGH
jgi:hypothetical protein